MKTLIDQLLEEATKDRCKSCGEHGALACCPKCDPNRLRAALHFDHPKGRAALLIILASLETTCRRCHGKGVIRAEWDSWYGPLITEKEMNDGERKCNCNNGKLLTEEGRAVFDFMKRWTAEDDR